MTNPRTHAHRRATPLDRYRAAAWLHRWDDDPEVQIGAADYDLAIEAAMRGGEPHVRAMGVPHQRNLEHGAYGSDVD